MTQRAKPGDGMCGHHIKKESSVPCCLKIRVLGITRLGLVPDDSTRYRAYRHTRHPPSDSSHHPNILHRGCIVKEHNPDSTFLLVTMADEESQPLLKGQASSSTSHLVSTSSSHRVSTTSTRSGEYHRSFQLSSESTPLLHRRDDIKITYGTDGANETNETDDRHSGPPSIASREAGPPDDVPTKKSRVRWPTVISLVGLTTGVLAILVFAFATPAVVKEYAQGAAVFEPTTLSINSTTPEGVRARIQGSFVMDSSRVKSNAVRNYGRFMTWIAREVETGPSDVDVYLPEYGNVLIGTAAVPNIKVNIRNGHENKVDFLTDLTAGDVKGIHAIAMDWIEGRLARLRVKGKATLHLKSGLILLGTQVLSDTVTFEGGLTLATYIRYNHITNSV